MVHVFQRSSSLEIIFINIQIQNPITLYRTLPTFSFFLPFITHNLKLSHLNCLWRSKGHSTTPSSSPSMAIVDRPFLLHRQLKSAIIISTAFVLGQNFTSISKVVKAFDLLYSKCFSFLTLLYIQSHSK